ncbi:hypothetical protein V5735_13055 (plasmid) [Haladaptatus sp. SPP-AMP-3]|uniref:hypothetical protein n=1 Tax=Haladaptatus sp. SPP-AMP-3 TaxID=3121295 RepID=UPI003C2AD5AE
MSTPPSHRSLLTSFTGVSEGRIHLSDEVVRRALVAEGIRLAIADIVDQNDDWPTVHNLRLRNWVTRKLQTVLDFERDADDRDSDIDTHLFRRVLTEGPEPSLEFLGDIIELDGGYYASAPTRAVMTTESTAVLISGLPTRSFTETFSVELRGTSRYLVETSKEAIEASGIKTIPIEAYVDIEEGQSFDFDWLETFFEGAFDDSIHPEVHWRGFQRCTPYGIEWGDEENDIRKPGTFYSVFQDLGENRAANYWLRRKPVEENPRSEFAQIPRRYLKYVCLILDNINDTTHEVIFEYIDEGLVVKADFKPPRPIFRWMAASGAVYSPAGGYMRWVITPDDKESTAALFDTLPVTIIDNS